jgi:hypothetical protein
VTAGGPFVSEPALWLRRAPVLGALAAGTFLLAVPLLQGRLYGAGQIVLYLALAALLAWLAHWCCRTIEVGDETVRLRSRIHTREVPLEGLRVEVRRGWWTRVVLLPPGGFQTSYLDGLWSPDPLAELRERLPAGAVREERTPPLSGPGPAEGE